MNELSTKVVQRLAIGCLVLAIVFLALFSSDREKSFETKQDFFVFRALPSDTKIYKNSLSYLLETEGEDFLSSAYTPVPLDSLKDEREKIHLLYKAPGYEPITETYTAQQYKALLQGEQHPIVGKPPVRLKIESYATVFFSKLKTKPYFFIAALLALGGAWFFRKHYDSLLRLELLKELGENSGGDDSKYVGKRISEYLLVKQLGKGGQSSTYKAVIYDRFGTKREEEGVVAIKILNSRDDEERLEQEFGILRTLKHPNVLGVFEQGITEPKEFGDSLRYMVMEFIDGHELEDIVCQKQSAEGVESGEESQEEVFHVFEPAKVAKLLKPIAAGLQHAHDKGITHRDIKPQNIMLRGGEEPVLIDFGLSKKEQEERIERVTKTGQIFGTPVYLSPEQLVNTKHSDKATDQYALGVIVYHMLGGCLPHAKNTGEHFFNLQQKKPGKSLHEVAPHISKSICEVVDKMIHPESKERFEGVQAAYEAFEKALKS